MGKNSSSKTKGGRYVNPTDKARKEARKKELKKNKKQRELVRTALLKSKEPKQIIEELETIDDMEYNAIQAPTIHLSVLQDKRRKLRATLDRLIGVYHKDSPESLGELRTLITNYDLRRSEREAYYEQVRSAERVKPDQIPLPSDLPPPTTGMWSSPGSISLPAIPKPPPPPPPAGILKKTQAQVMPTTSRNAIYRRLKDVLGPPPGQPPVLSDSEDESAVSKRHKRSRSRSVSASSSGSSSASSSDESRSNSANSTDSDGSSKHSDDSRGRHHSRHRRHRHHRSQGEPTSSIRTSSKSEDQRNSKQSKSLRFADDVGKVKSKSGSEEYGTLQPPVPQQASLIPFQLPTMSMPPPPPPYMAGVAPQHSVIFQAPPSSLRQPPPTPQQQQAIQEQAAAVKLQMEGQTSQQRRPAQPQQVAPPAVDRKLTTIEKKAQLKNLLAESTKFIPPQLQIRREVKDAHGRIIRQQPPPSLQSDRPVQSFATGAATASVSSAATKQQAANKDDAYAQFMRELDGFL